MGSTLQLPLRRREGGGREREGARERETSGREEDFPPPASSRDGSNFRREETRGERRGKSAGEREEKFSSSFPLSAHMPACRRELEREGGGRERESGREEDFPPPASSRDGSNFRREETRGERRGKSAGEREEKFSSSFPLSAHMPACRRELEREGGGRERESGREEDFPPPASSRDGKQFPSDSV